MLYFDQFYVPEKNNERVILRGNAGQKCRIKFLYFETFVFKEIDFEYFKNYLGSLKWKNFILFFHEELSPAPFKINNSITKKTKVRCTKHDVSQLSDFFTLVSMITYRLTIRTNTRRNFLS